MPKLKTEVVETPPEPQEGMTYNITEASFIKTQRRGWEGIRVSLKGTDGTIRGTMLWLRDVAGPKSKVGAFVNLLGDDTDQWIGKNITIVKWQEGNRQIQLAPPS